MNTLSIRDMTPTDIPAVLSIGNGAPELAVSDVSRFWSQHRLESWLAAGQDVMLVAEQDGRVVGFVLTQLHVPSQVGYLSDLVVTETARGQGIGTALIDETVNRMVALDLTYIYGLTQETNERIHNLLEKDGFSKGETMIWYEKKVNR